MIQWYTAIWVFLSKHLQQLSSSPWWKPLLGKFQKYCNLRANHFWPFTFNKATNTNYMKSFIAIFKCTKVKVNAELFNYYLRNGLLDPNHTMGKRIYIIYLCTLHNLNWFYNYGIGEIYPAEKWKPYLMMGSFKWMPVFFRGGNLNPWTITCAMIPPLENWGTDQAASIPWLSFSAKTNL